MGFQHGGSSPQTADKVLKRGRLLRLCRDVANQLVILIGDTLGKIPRGMLQARAIPDNGIYFTPDDIADISEPSIPAVHAFRDVGYYPGVKEFFHLNKRYA